MDYLRMNYFYKKCSGILIKDNTIESNIGCPKAFGNIIVSCEPDIV